MTIRKDEKKREKYDEALIRVGEVLEGHRKEIYRGKSRKWFIEEQGEVCFNDTEWISERHLTNLEKGKNWISIECLLKLATALNKDPVELFEEIVKAWRGNGCEDAG